MALALITDMFNQRSAGAKAITIRINSRGGDVDAGMAISRAIEGVGVPVRCIVDGYSHSMAFYILQSCTTREMTARSTLLAHEPKLPPAAVADPETILNNMNYMRALARAMAEHESSRLTISLEEFMDLTDGKDWILNSGPALEAGAIDAVVSPHDIPQYDVLMVP
jgi:ATP-dependent protease ClpP protease subunit